MIINFEEIDKKERYKIMSNSIVPRPIAWIVTQGEEVINLAPFSYFIPLSSEPPVVVVSVGHKADGSMKDTLKNILEHRKATICMVTSPLLEKMDKTAQPLPYSKSEVVEFEIETETILKEYPPIVKGTPCAFFCDFHSKIEIGGSTIPLILRISHYFNNNVERCELVGRVGKEYCVCKDRIWLTSS